MKHQPEKPRTFDGYAGDYAALIQDPIRDKFAGDGRFFFKRKIQVIQAFFNRAGITTGNLDWLDIGCGQGDLLRLGRSSFKSASGCDPSKGMLKSCEDLDVRHQESMETLPFEDTRFDFVTSVCVYHHVPVEHRPLLTREALRVLRMGGIFCIIEHNALNPVTRLIVSRTPVDAGAKLLTAGESGRLFASTGCRVLETRYFLLFPERLHRFAGSIEDALASVPFGGQYAVFAQRC